MCVWLVPCRREITVALEKGPLKNYKTDLIFENPIPGLTSRRTLADVTFRNEFAPTYLIEASKELGAAAAMGERTKDLQYKAALSANNFDFLPLALDRMGYARPLVEVLANYLIAQRALIKGTTFAESALEFWQTLSFTIHKAASLNIMYRYRTIKTLTLENDSD